MGYIRGTSTSIAVLFSPLRAPDGNTTNLLSPKQSRQQGKQQNVETDVIPGRSDVAFLPAPSELGPGDMVGGYEIIRFAGRGGMGTVYIARDNKLGRHVAIKQIFGANEALTARFLREARATARCNHENIVVIHEVSEEAGVPFMVLEYIEGQTLQELYRPGECSVGQALDIAIPVTRALVHAHKLGLVHRDLKPENIMLSHGGMIKVLDFGIVKAFSDPENHALDPSDVNFGKLLVTQHGHAVGTPPFMSPEQIRGEETDGRSDLWSLGIILYELLVGHHPLGQEITRERLLALHDRREGTLSDLELQPRGISKKFAAIIDRCLCYNADERYEDSSELLTALEDSVTGQKGTMHGGKESPYPGLVAFDTSQANLFFGRANEIQRIRVRLREQALVALVGPSGAGKSSLVRAGLAPTLRKAGEPWAIYHIRPGTAPMENLAALANKLNEGSQEQSVSIHQLQEEPGLLGAILRRCARASGGSTLLCIDQMEELYTLCPSLDDRNLFVNCLLAAADTSSSPIRVVLSMRSDFIDRCSENPKLFHRLTAGMILVPPLERAAMRSALVNPAELAGYEFEDEALVAKMVDDLATSSGGLPLLQFAANKLWDSRDQDARTLTHEGYLLMGGLAGALATHADQVLADLPTNVRKSARTVFQRLVTSERTRSIVPIQELLASSSDPDSARELIDRLVSARLVVVDSDVDDPTLEIVHESLINQWPQLARWLSEAQEDVAFLDQLRVASKQWQERGQPQGLLWRDSAMQDARRWRTTNPNARLPERERVYIAEVLRLADKARIRKRYTVIGALLLMGAIAMGAIAALLLINRSESNARATAEEARGQSERALSATQLAREEQEKREKESSRRQRAETTASSASAQVKETQEDLRETNKRLEEALREQQSEAERARTASKTAQREAARALAAEKNVDAQNKSLQKLLTEREKRVRQLESQMRNISTDLK